LAAISHRLVGLFHGFGELLGRLIYSLLLLFVHNAQATFSVWLSHN
jgi:hypothetical protein